MLPQVVCPLTDWPDDRLGFELNDSLAKERSATKLESGMPSSQNKMYPVAAISLIFRVKRI
jgi:hypothetical protein